MFSLGIWQMNRASEKEQLQNTVIERTQHSPISLNQTYLNESEKEQTLNPYEKATVKGYYQPSEQFLLDNIIHNGKPGYYAITPFKIQNTNKVILVNRGWIPQGKTRQTLPEFSISTDKRSLSGIIAKPRSKPVILGSIDQPISENPKLWYYMDVKYFEKNVGYSVLPWVLRLETEDLLPITTDKRKTTTKLIREWPVFDAKTGMHIGYAIQWFVFALFVLFAFVGLSFKKQIRISK